MENIETFMLCPNLLKKMEQLRIVLNCTFFERTQPNNYHAMGKQWDWISGTDLKAFKVYL